MTRSPAQAFQPIRDVMTVPLNAFGDARGRFMETFRVEWFPQVNWDRMQSNRSDSVAGVLRGLHYHFKQIDYWYATRGQYPRRPGGSAPVIFDLPGIRDHRYRRR